LSDYEYYLSLQVLPPIERLCEPIEGTDRARLAECLGELLPPLCFAARAILADIYRLIVSGLDPERYATKAAGGDVEREFTTLGSQISDKERFADSTPLELRCMHCEHTTLFGGLLNDTVRAFLAPCLSQSGKQNRNSTSLQICFPFSQTNRTRSSSPTARLALNATFSLPPLPSPSSSRTRSARTSQSTIEGR
jgi:hypothetical protein